MFQNYLTTALRNMARNSLFTFINIAGLALGLLAVTLITLFVVDELSYDRHITGSENIYRMESHFTLPGRDPIHSSMGSGRAKFGFLEEFPEITELTRLLPTTAPVRSGENLFSEAVFYADSNALSMLDVRFIEGSRDAALVDTSSVVISADAAQKYFGSESALNKSITMTLDAGQRDYRITGVIENLPQTSHLEMNMLVLLDDAVFAQQPNISARWMATNMYVYLKLEPGASIDALNAKFPDFIDRFATPEIKEFGMPFDSATAIARWEAIPIKDIHLYGAPTQPIKPPGSVANIISFSVVAILILAMAIMNFANLTAARGTKRLKEISVRKVMGASRKQLAVQIIGETLLTVAISVVIALTAAEIALPYYSNFLGKDLSLDLVNDAGQMPIILAATGLITLLGGAYPAWLLTSFQPADVLHSQASANSSGDRHRSILVVIQFAASIMLLIATIVVYNQTSYMQTIDSGYRTSGMMVVHGFDEPDLRRNAAAFKTSVTNLAEVKSAALSSWAPADAFNGGTRATLPGLDEPVVMVMRRIDFDYFTTYDVRPVAGRTQDQQYANDLIRTFDSDVRDGNVVINEAAARSFGFASASAAVDQSFQLLADASDPTKTINATVAGVIPDLLERSARERISPTVYFVDERSLRKLSVYFETDNLPALTTQIESIWKQFAPNTPFQVDFVDDRIANQYQGEAAASLIFAVFSSLAIIISSLGLYGLASFATESRTREIGIRKVFGASTWLIVRLLTLQFSKPVIVANIIAWPLAWYFLTDWLNNFSFQVNLTVLPFLLASVATLVAAWLTVGSRAYVVAKSKPINALRHV